MRPKAVRLTLAVSVLFAAAAALLTGLLLPRPWPLVVLHSDVYAAVGGGPSLFYLITFVLNLLVLVGVLLLGRLLSQRKLKGQESRIASGLLYVASATAATLLIAAYPVVKSLIRSQAIEVGEETMIVLLDRNVYYAEDRRWRGLVVATDLEAEMPLGWPFSLLHPETTIKHRVSHSELERILAELQQRFFFGFPEQLDPRPSLDHAALYLAVHQRGHTSRAFGRVSDPGFERLGDAAEVLLQQLGLGADWWETSRSDGIGFEIQ